MVSVCVAGATGWTGRAVAEAVREAADLDLVSAVTRSHAGSDLGRAWGGEDIGVPVHGSVADAVAGTGVDVLVDYTSHAAVKANALAAVAGGAGVVIGSSGLGAADFAEIDAAAREHGVGVVAAGNFSLTAAMAKAAALLVARHLPYREVVDYASFGKPDSPSGTATELAEALSEVDPGPLAVSIAETSGHPEARGATLGATQVHSLRLPSFTVSTEVVFGLPDERLSIRHDCGSSAAPYVAGTLLAIRAVPGITGVVRGLDTLLLTG
jgi:4-hydroxy-tetrahydrodipicolinate reductase